MAPSSNSKKKSKKQGNEEDERLTTTTPKRSSSRRSSRRLRSSSASEESKPETTATNATSTDPKMTNGSYARETRSRSRTSRSSEKKKKPKKKTEPLDMDDDDNTSPQQDPSPSLASLSSSSSKSTTTTTTTATRKRRATSLQEEGDENGNKLEDENENTPTPPPPTMDLQVHRLRHLEYIPSPIVSMASKGNTAAVAREDGSFELVEVISPPSPPQENNNKGRNHSNPRKVVPVSKIMGSSRIVGHSSTFCGNSCVAASPDGTLWIVDFATGQLQSRISSGGGGIFDLVSLSETSLPIVAAACQDGSIRFYVLKCHPKDGKTIFIQDTPIATLPTTGAAVLSLAWRVTNTASSDGKSTNLHTSLFAGVSDGTIRNYSLEFRVTNDDEDGDAIALVQYETKLRMTMESRGRRTATKIWTMKLLKDGTLCTGNSLGQVQFWNSSTGTLLQTMTQSEFKTDVLQLVVNQEETKLFCSGVDARVNCYERMSRDENDMDIDSHSHLRNDWKLTTAQRPHTHDIKAMVILTSSTKDQRPMETLLTGGVDTKLCSYLVPEFSKRRPQVWYPWPSVSPITTTASSCEELNPPKLLSMQRHDQVELYQLEDTGSSSDHPAAKKIHKPGSTLLGTIVMEQTTKTPSNLVVSKLSSNGKWLAMSNATSLWVFHLEITTSDRDDNDRTLTVVPEKMALPKALEQLAVVTMEFCQDVLFVADSSSPRSHKIYCVDLSKQKQEEDCISFSTITIPKPATEKDDEGEALPIHSIHADGNYLVVSSRQKEGGIHVFKKKHTSHSYQPYWTLPGLSGERAAAVTLTPGGKEDRALLAVATFANHIYLFDLKEQKLSPWSERYGFPIRHHWKTEDGNEESPSWPFEMSNRKDFPVRLTVNPNDSFQLILVRFEC